MTDVQSGVPQAAMPFVTPQGMITQAWRQFLVTLWARTGGGSGGGTFNQNTPFNLSAIAGLASTVTRTLVQRMADYITVKDFGALCDGVTDDTAAWNLAIAAVNAGVIGTIRVPGWSRVTGALTTITNSCRIEGWGIGVSGLIHQGGDVTMLSVNFPANLFRFSMMNLSLRSDQANLGQALSIRQSTHNLTHSVHLMNVDITGTATKDKGFNRGVETINVSNATFVNVNNYGYVSSAGVYPATVQHQAWAWNSWAEAGMHSVNNRWTDCDVTWVIQAWQGLTGDLQGYSWVTCCPVFVGNAWKFETTEAGAAPYFEWVNCQSEVFGTGYYLQNVAWVCIADCQCYLDSNIAGTQYGVYVGGTSVGVIVHDVFLNVGDGVAGAVGTTSGIVLDGVSTGSIHHNSIRGFKGYGIRFTGTTQNCMSEMDTIESPVAGATIYDNDGANAATNRRRRMQITNWASDPGSVAAAASSGTAIGTAVTSVCTVAMPSIIGDEIEFQAQVYVTPLTTANSIAYAKIREITHKPSSPTPYQVIQFADTQNGETITAPLNNTAGGGSGPVEAFQPLCFTARVIATAKDAVYSLDLWNSNTFEVIQIAEMRAIRR